MTFYMRPLAQMGEKRFGHCWILLTNVDGQLPSAHVVCKNQTSSAQRVGFFNIGSGRVGYWKKYRVAGRVRVG